MNADSFCRFSTRDFRAPLIRLGDGSLLPTTENSRRLWLSEIPCRKGFPANFDAAGKLFPDFPATRNAIPARFDLFPVRKTAAGKLAAPSGTLLDWGWGNPNASDDKKFVLVSGSSWGPRYQQDLFKNFTVLPKTKEYHHRC